MWLVPTILQHANIEKHPFIFLPKKCSTRIRCNLLKNHSIKSQTKIKEPKRNSSAFTFPLGEEFLMKKKTLTQD